MTMQIVLASTVHLNMRVAMSCFTAGALLILVGWYMWHKQKAEWIPGYRKVENEDTKTYCRLVGQAHMIAGAGMILFSLPLNEENPNKVFTIVMCICCFVMIGIAFAMYIKATKMRRK